MIRAAALCLMLAGTAHARSDPALTAERAAEALREAGNALEAAGGARNRVATLTDTIRAYEDGLRALRAGIREATARETAIRDRLDAESARIGGVLGALQTMGTGPEAQLLLHPGGPMGSARAGMILRAVTPALLSEAAELRADLTRIAELRSLQDSAAETLRDGLKGVQTARTRLSQAVAVRTDLPRRVTDDPDEMRRLADSAETLRSFAARLRPDTGSTLPDFASAKGTLPLPVRGRVRHGWREADAAGVRRPGLVLETRPGALVTTPWPATIRYRGPLLDYKNVMILEPSPGYLLVLAGLDTVYGATGEVLPGGAPVGLMGGDPLAPSDHSAVSDTAPTLYLELRHQQTPVNPADWFKLDEDES